MGKTSLPNELHTLLRKTPSLARLTRAARSHAPRPTGEQQDPLACLPPALRDRVTLVEDENRWLVMVENSATAQLLRFHLPKLEKALGVGKPAKIVVTGRRGPGSPTGKPLFGKAPAIDPASAAYISEAADYVDDEDLAASLRRLASRSQ